MQYKINSSVIKSVDGKVKYKQPNVNGKKHFHLGIWLEASDRDLDEVAYVEYKLHPSFKKQIRKSKNRPNNFSITIWTWGVFNIDTTIHFHSGETKTIKYYLNYNLPQKSSDYIKV